MGEEDTKQTKKEEKGGKKDWLDKLCAYDLFAFSPIPRFNKMSGAYGTRIGLFFTISILVIFGLYVSATLARFLDDNISISIESFKADNRNFQPMVNFYFDIPSICNQRFFTVSVQHRESAPGQKTNKTDLKTMCQNSSGRMFVPITNISEAMLIGNCKIEECNYVRLKVFPCDNLTTTMPTKCATPQEINDVVDNNYLTLYLNGTLRGYPTLLSFELSLKDAMSFRKILTFHVSKITTNPNYVRHFEPFSVHELTLADESFSIDRMPRLPTGDSEYGKIDFQLSGTYVKENRNPETLADLMGSWAAFWGALTTILMIVLHKVNTELFYHDYPKWDGWNARFEFVGKEEDEEKKKDGATLGEDGGGDLQLTGVVTDPNASVPPELSGGGRRGSAEFIYPPTFIPEQNEQSPPDGQK